MSIRQAQYNQDNNLWETNRMITSGVVQRTEIDMDFDDNQEVLLLFSFIYINIIHLCIYKFINIFINIYRQEFIY